MALGVRSGTARRLGLHQPTPHTGMTATSDVDGNLTQPVWQVHRQTHYTRLATTSIQLHDVGWQTADDEVWQQRARLSLWFNWARPTPLDVEVWSRMRH